MVPYLCKEKRRIWIGLPHAVQMAYQAGRRMKNAFRKKVNMSSPTLQMMCPGVLQVNACHQQGEQQGLIRWTGEYRDCAIAKLVP